MTSAVRCWVDRQIAICADRTSSPQTARRFLVLTDCDGWCVGRVIFSWWKLTKVESSEELPLFLLVVQVCAVPVL